MCAERSGAGGIDDGVGPLSMGVWRAAQKFIRPSNLESAQIRLRFPRPLQHVALALAIGDDAHNPIRTINLDGHCSIHAARFPDDTIIMFILTIV